MGPGIENKIKDDRYLMQINIRFESIPERTGKMKLHLLRGVQGGNNNYHRFIY